MTGYQLVVPVMTIAGDIVLTNFGWLRGNAIRGQLPSLTSPVTALFSNQSQQFTGVVSYPSINTMVSETNIAFGKFPALLQQIDVTQIKQHLSATGILTSGKLFPFVVNLSPQPNSEFVRNWQPVVMSPDKHLGYAVQWFGLGIAALTIYLLSLMKLFNTKNNKEN
jgi:cytochrome oxidase assembly protein ShyY1